LLVGRLAQPAWLDIDDPSTLKAKLPDVIGLFIVIKFLDER